MRMVAAFKNHDQTSKSNIELFIIVYITVFEAVLFLRFLRSNIMIKHQSQTSTCSSISSSESPSSTMSSLSSCCFWLLHDCNVHISVHASQFAMLIHFGSLQERTHLQANNCCWWRPHPVNGELAVIVYPSTLGRVGHCGTSLKTALPDCCLVVSSKELREETIYLCMVLADWTQSLPVWHNRAGSAGRSSRQCCYQPTTYDK